MSAAFDPLSRPLVPHRGFDELQIGEQFPCPARTLTDAHFSAFQLISGDNHPIHYDRPYCAAAGHRDLLAHGLHILTLTAAGAGLFPHVIGVDLIGFIEVQAKFLKAVYPGDTSIHCWRSPRWRSSARRALFECERRFTIRMASSSSKARTLISSNFDAAANT